MRISPLFKGIITAACMVSFSLLAYRYIATSSRLHYLVYAVYALGIIWTLVSYRLSPDFSGRFRDIFSNGFRCFIIATLIMAVYTFIFTKSHPEFAEESSKAFREQLVAEKKPLTPTDMEAVDKQVARYKKSYSTTLVYGSIFGYLIIGAGLSAIGAALLTRRT